MEDQSTDQFETEDFGEASGLSWQASEYIYHKKPGSWYLMVIGFTAALIIFALITRQWLTVAVFAMAAMALLVYANKAPRTLDYQLDEAGLTVADKFYPYEQFKSFAVLQDVAWHAIDLEPTKRFMPRLTILFSDDNRDEIIDILAQYLPEQDREPDIIDRIARRLKL